MMTTISDKDRAEAQAMAEKLHGRDLVVLSDDNVRRWLGLRDHVLAAHECPTVPVWRPTTADEIQAGWEVRSRGRAGSEMNWGVAHHQDEDGDWRTEAGALLADASLGWTYETTTAPLPEPEPWDDDTLDEWEGALRSTIDLDAGWATSTRAVLNLLASRGLIERPKAGACRREAKSPEALRHLLATERDWRCPMGVTRKGEYEPCENNATTVVAYDFDGEWFLDPVCTFHANRAGRGNGVHLADLLNAARED